MCECVCVCVFTCCTFVYFQVKETRKAVKDSQTGIQKMAIGHHIGMPNTNNTLPRF